MENAGRSAAEEVLRLIAERGSRPGRVVFSSRRRHTSSLCDWSSDVCSSDLSSWRFAWLRDASLSGRHAVGVSRWLPIHRGGTGELFELPYFRTQRRDGAISVIKITLPPACVIGDIPNALNAAASGPAPFGSAPALLSRGTTGKSGS